MKDIEVTAYGLTVEVDEKVVTKALKRLNKGTINSFFKDATQSDLEQLFDVCNVIEDEMVMERLRNSGLWGSFLTSL